MASAAASKNNTITAAVNKPSASVLPRDCCSNRRNIVVHVSEHILSSSTVGSRRFEDEADEEDVDDDDDDDDEEDDDGDDDDDDDDEDDDDDDGVDGADKAPAASAAEPLVCLEASSRSLVDRNERSTPASTSGSMRSLRPLNHWSYMHKITLFVCGRYNG